MDKTKKIAAAVSAVMMYIKTEEEQVMANGQLAGIEQSSPEIQLGGTANLWGISGRQDIMQLRTMMQLRTFR